LAIGTRYDDHQRKAGTTREEYADEALHRGAGISGAPGKVDTRAQFDGGQAHSLGTATAEPSQADLEAANREITELGVRWVKALIPAEGVHMEDGTKVTRIVDPSELPEAVRAAWRGHNAIVVADNEQLGYVAFIGLHHIYPVKLGDKYFLSGGVGGLRRGEWKTIEKAMIDALDLGYAMTYKTASVGFNILPVGGSKTMVHVRDMASRTEDEINAIYASLGKVLGRFPVTFVGVDMNTSDDQLAIVGQYAPDSVVGVPGSHLAGVAPSPWTARGVFAAMKETLARRGETLRGKLVTVQGYGNVSHTLVDLLLKDGAKVIVNDIPSEKAERVKKLKKLYGEVRIIEPEEEFDFQAIQPGGFVYLDMANNQDDRIYRIPGVDIFSPNGPKNILNATNIALLKAAGVRYVPGAANEQLATREDAELLLRLGIKYGVDYFINAGGVSAVYVDLFRVVMEEIVKQIGKAVADLIEQAEKEGVSPKLLADRISLARIMQFDWENLLRAREVVAEAELNLVRQNLAAVDSRSPSFQQLASDADSALLQLQGARAALADREAGRPSSGLSLGALTLEQKKLTSGPRAKTLPLGLEAFGRNVQIAALAALAIGPAYAEEAGSAIELAPAIATQLGAAKPVFAQNTGNTQVLRALFVEADGSALVEASALDESILLAGLNPDIRITVWVKPAQVESLEARVERYALAKYKAMPGNFSVAAAPRDIAKTLDSSALRVPTGVVGAEALLERVAPRRGLLRARAALNQPVRLNLTAALLAEKLREFGLKDSDSKIYTGEDLADVLGQEWSELELALEAARMTAQAA
ncbi:MAG: hypothetical protein HY586_03735, partial [Candidatus Omnitrophica bacterium]|nr:hypothetical protein [Candidatus Omnitrophota bacterium]